MEGGPLMAWGEYIAVGNAVVYENKGIAKSLLATDVTDFLYQAE